VQGRKSYLSFAKIFAKALQNEKIAFDPSFEQGSLGLENKLFLHYDMDSYSTEGTYVVSE
jgi:hypothetical protein